MTIVFDEGGGSSPAGSEGITPYVRANRSSGNITLGAETAVAWSETKYESVAGMHDPATNNSRLYCPTDGDGIYQVRVKFRMDIQAAQRMTVHFYKNTTQFHHQERAGLGSGPNYDSVQVDSMVVLAAGDYVECKVDGSGTALANAGDDVDCWFEMIRLGRYA